MSSWAWHETMLDSHGDEVTVGVLYTGKVVIDAGAASNFVVLDAAKQEEFAQLYAAACHQAKASAEAARAAMPGQPYRRPCCDHCNNLEGDPDAHDYVPGGSAHDGPCEECAAEKARREHDEGTG